MDDPLAGKYPMTQSWAEHLRNAGPTLGGVDYAMAVGTRLPVVSGTPSFTTSQTFPRPIWYNTGLGWVGSYLRPDGTRTIYGHLSGQDGNVFLSGGLKGAPGAGVSTGPHVHVHDLAANGSTRLYPFSTAQPVIPINKDDEMPRIMTRPTQETPNTVAIFDEFRWQEFNTGTPNGAMVVDFLQKSFASVPYDAKVWDFRSNKHPELKSPFYTYDGTNNSLTPIPVAGGSINYDLLAAKIVAATPAATLDISLTGTATEMK